MAVLSSIGSRLVPAAKWLAPSLVAACAGAIAAGLVESLGGAGDHRDALGVAATTGFVALVAAPALFGASIVVRAIVAAWRPGAIAARVIEPDGSAPRLAGWAAMIWLAVVLSAWAGFQGTWLLAAQTTFKPVVVAFVETVIIVAALLGLVAVSRPAATLFAAIARRIDVTWRRRGHSTLLRPVAILAGAVAAAVILGVILWFALIKRHVGAMLGDGGRLVAPTAAALVTIAAHVVRGGLGRAATTVGIAIAALAALAIGAAALVLAQDPARTLAIWGERPIAGLAIERLFDLDAIRGRRSLAAYTPSERPGAPHPDLVLVTFETVRADHTPPYGGPAAMPVLRELATRGSVFTFAFAPSNVTRRSLPSMMTGLQPNRVHTQLEAGTLQLDPRHVLLAERLRAAGYETAGFFSGDEFADGGVRTRLAQGLDHVELQARGLQAADRARAWLDARERQPVHRPLFLWLHVADPDRWSTAYGEAHNDDERRLSYDRALASADTTLFEVIGAFSQRAPEHAPIVIVTSDHGEGLGEHGQIFHATDLYNSQIRVPLVIAGPGIKVQRVLETVSLTDLVPTLIDLAGFDPPAGDSIDGRSIAPITTGARAPDPEAGTAFAAMIEDKLTTSSSATLIKGKFKLLEKGMALELCEIHTDADERYNVAASHPQQVKELRLALEAAQAAARRAPF